MLSSSKIIKNKFFAVSLQEHKVFGVTFTPYIVELLNEDGGVYAVVENIFLENLTKWSDYIPDAGEKVVRIIEEVSDSQLFKVVGKRQKSYAEFYRMVLNDEVFGNYVRSFFERRIAKCFDLLAESNIPVFHKDKRSSNIYHDHLLELNTKLAQPVFRFSLEPSETRYALEATYNGERIKLNHKNSQVVTNEPCIIRLGYRVFRFEGIDAKKLKPFFLKDYISIPKTAEAKYYETFVKNSIKNQIVVAEGFTIEDSTPTANAILSLEPRLNGELGLILFFRYGAKKYLSQTKPQREVQLQVNNGTYNFTRFSRDVEWENSIKGMLEQKGLVNVQGAEYYPVKVRGDYEVVDWIRMNSEMLAREGVEVVQNINEVNYYLNGYVLNLSAKLQNDWFDVFGNVVLKDYEFPFIHLRKNIIREIREYALPNGEVFLIPVEWFAKYIPLFNVGRVEDEKLVLNQSSFGFIQEAHVQCPEASLLQNRFEGIALSQRILIPAGLNAQLREYQKLGLLWLQLLNESSIGGCLADDMGLGKTIQTLAVLLHDLEKQNLPSQHSSSNGIAQMGHTSLLVVPTSLLFNWQREIKRFAKSLSVYQFTGPNRTRSILELVNFHIVITTYGVLRNDIDMLKDVRFNYVVLDESQTIKNPVSKVYRSAMLLKAKHYLSLSGTPIENSLTDLWAQLNFLNRGMLGSLRSFRQQFIIPIEKNKDEGVQKRLKKLVQPFILRRSKREVAPELPELNEQIIFCNLSDDQRSIYEEEKSAIRNHILDNINSQGYGQSAISILRGLTRLRQISNHPRMLDEYWDVDSGKFDEISRIIQVLVEENHKILVFSSFVKHLKIVEAYLTQMSIGYQMLIGSTTNRQQIVDNFQNDPGSQVFLISIKAGGTGLNLTAADYILVLDPWWNLAIENQAIARAHRIGQDKPVFVYRFISVETVEEKIQRLQEDKLLLSAEFIDNSNPLSLFSKEQMLEILA